MRRGRRLVRCFEIRRPSSFNWMRPHFGLRDIGGLWICRCRPSTRFRASIYLLSDLHCGISLDRLWCSIIFLRPFVRPFIRTFVRTSDCSFVCSFVRADIRLSDPSVGRTVRPSVNLSCRLTSHPSGSSGLPSVHPSVRPSSYPPVVSVLIPRW